MQMKNVNHIVCITRRYAFLPELKVDGVEVNLEGFDRYSNPFTKMAWGDRQISVQVTFFLKSLDNRLIFIWKIRNSFICITGRPS